MKQLFAAGSLSGSPQAGAGNGSAVAGPPAVRAATAGVSADEVDAALRLAGYAPPPARLADAEAPLPVRLALLSSPSAGRVLAHVTPGRTGRYIAHALLNVPPTADAQLAIQTWGSPLWQTTEPDGPAELPDMPYLPVADVLDDAALKDWLGSPMKRELLEFVLTALVVTPPLTRIILATTADEVAKVVYAVTRSMPPGTLDDFTFSTFEPDPLLCNARLIGHDTGSPIWEMPTAYYEELGVAYNPNTGKRSELPNEAPFAAFAVQALATGDFGPLDEFKATWQRLGLPPEKLDLAFRLGRGTGVLAKEEAADALKHPPVAAWVSARSDVLKQFLEWAMEDREFAAESFSRVVQALRQKPDTLIKLGQTVREAGLKALKGADRSRTANALEVILPMVAPGKANAVWGEILSQLPDPAAVDWDMRWYLLPKFVRYKHPHGPESGVDPLLAAWVAVPTEKLGELLGLDLPRAYHLTAARTALAAEGEPTPELARAVAAYPQLALTLLQPSEGIDAERAVKLFEQFLSEAPGQPWFESLLANAGNYPSELLNRFLEVSLAAGKVNAERTIRTQGDRLIELFAGKSGLDRVGKLFLAEPPADLLANESLLGFLDRLKEDPAASEELKDRIAAVKSVRAYLDAPGFDPDAMRTAADGLRHSPPAVPPSAKAEVFAALAAEVLKRANSPNLQEDLEAALTHFGDVLASDPTDLYENLLRELRGRTDLPRNPNLVHTFLALALGAAKNPNLAAKLDGLDGHAFAVASDAAKFGGHRLLDDLHKRTADWPKPARVQWGFLKEAVKPAGSGRLVRDAVLFLAGAAFASAAWWVVKLTE